MKTGIIFDLDGTLLNTLEDIKDAVNYALSQFGYPKRSLEEVRQFVGNGALRLIQRSVPDGVEAEPVFAAFQVYYQAHCQIKTAPYPGILEALEAIGEQYPIAIVSNKPDGAVKALCNELFPGIYALGELPPCPRKPAPDMLKRAMADIGVDTCVYVGDSEVDIATARNTGVPCLSVLWGFRDEEQLRCAGGNCFCQTPLELVTALRQHFQL